ncbi:hypothetical protein ACTXT7_002300 [Hymenolepis weldensis]
MNKGDDTGGERLRSAAKLTHTWESGGMDEDTERVYINKTPSRLGQMKETLLIATCSMTKTVLNKIEQCEGEYGIKQ